MATHRQRRHLFDLFDRRGRAERDAQLVQAAEHEAAVRRILDYPTMRMPVIDPVQPGRAPLMTPLQRARGNGGER